MHPTNLAESSEILFPVHDIPMEMLLFWQTSINRGDVDAMCSCFHPAAVIRPTFKKGRLCTSEEIRAYKENLAETGTRLETVSAVHLVRMGHDHFQAEGETVWHRFGELKAGQFSANLIHQMGSGWLFSLLHSSLNPPEGA